MCMVRRKDVCIDSTKVVRLETASRDGETRAKLSTGEEMTVDVPTEAG